MDSQRATGQQSPRSNLPPLASARQTGTSSGIQTIWASTTQTTNGEVHSGPRDFTLDGAYGQRVCVYYDRVFTGTGLRAAYYVGGGLLTVPQLPPAPSPTPGSTPAPTPSPTPKPIALGSAEAKNAVKSYMSKHYASFRRARVRSTTTLKQISSTKRIVSVKWTYKHRHYKKRVTVTEISDKHYSFTVR